MTYEINYYKTSGEVILEFYGHPYAVVAIYLSGGKFINYLTTEPYDSGETGDPYMMVDGYVALRERAELETKKLQLGYDKKNSLEKNLGGILSTTFEKNLVGQAVEDKLIEELHRMGWTKKED